MEVGAADAIAQNRAMLPRNVYRLDPATGKAHVAAADFTRPNGLGFSPDERLLYIVDSGISHGGPAHIRVFDVDGAHLRNGRVFDLPRCKG